MGMYFCPRCGEQLEASACVDDGGILRCPDCRTVRVLVRGRILIASGLVLVLLATQLVPPFVLVLGVVLAGGLCMLGLFRVIRQRRVRRVEDSDESFVDFDDVDDEDV